MAYSKEIIKKQYQELAEPLRRIITSPETTATLDDIARKHSFGYALDEIIEEVGFVLLGLTPLEKFPVQLAERLEFSLESIKDIADEIGEKIFLPVAGGLVSSPQAHPAAPKDEHLPDRSSILEGIENPAPAAPTIVEKEPAPTREVRPIPPKDNGPSPETAQKLAELEERAKAAEEKTKSIPPGTSLIETSKLFAEAALASRKLKELKDSIHAKENLAGSIV